MPVALSICLYVNGNIRTKHYTGSCVLLILCALSKKYFFLQSNTSD